MELTYRNGHYKLTVDYRNDNYAQVSAEDMGDCSLLWSSGMTYQKANAYIAQFKIKYMDIDDFDEMFKGVLI